VLGKLRVRRKELSIRGFVPRDDPNGAAGRAQGIDRVVAVRGGDDVAHVAERHPSLEFFVEVNGVGGEEHASHGGVDEHHELAGGVTRRRQDLDARRKSERRIDQVETSLVAQTVEAIQFLDLDELAGEVLLTRAGNPEVVLGSGHDEARVLENVDVSDVVVVRVAQDDDRALIVGDPERLERFPGVDENLATAAATDSRCETRIDDDGAVMVTDHPEVVGKLEGAVGFPVIVMIEERVGARRHEASVSHRHDFVSVVDRQTDPICLTIL
jgi:hypothetical protein